MWSNKKQKTNVKEKKNSKDRYKTCLDIYSVKVVVVVAVVCNNAKDPLESRACALAEFVFINGRWARIYQGPYCRAPGRGTAQHSLLILLNAIDCSILHKQATFGFVVIVVTFYNDFKRILEAVMSAYDIKMMSAEIVRFPITSKFSQQPSIKLIVECWG